MAKGGRNDNKRNYQGIRMHKNFIKASAAGLLTGLFLAVLFYAEVFEALDLKLLDTRFSGNSGRRTPSAEIVIVTIDQNSVDYLKRKMGVLWKWPRDVYANVIEYLKSSGARVIYLDFDMSDPDITRAGYEEGETDLFLGKAMEEAGNVVMPFLLYKELSTGEGSSQTDSEALKGFAVTIAGDNDIKVEGNHSAVAPIVPLMSKCRSLGAANLYPDRDGIIRRARLFHGLMADVYASAPLSVVLSLNGANMVEVEKGGGIRFGAHLARLNSDGEAYINWYGPGGPEGKTYRYFPIADVLLSNIRLKDGLKPIIDQKEFNGKIVMIGSNAPSLYDLKPTPVSGRGAYPGVEIAATVVNNLLDGSSMSRAGNRAVAALILVVCILTAFIVIFVRSVGLNVLLTLLVMLGVYYVAAAAYLKNLFLPVASAEAGVLLTFIAASAYNYITVGKERIWLKKAFSHYVPAPLVAEIMQNPDMLRLGGERRDVPILFTDLKGFTSMSEKIEPEQVAAVLNEYFTPMTEIVFRHNGTLDKYIGDALMAFWGAPVPLADCRADACHAALDMISGMERLKINWKEKGMPEFLQDLKVRIGINSGIVSVGNMGSSTRFNYTVIGDEVNLTSRLEGINKIYGTSIIVSEPVYISTRDRFIFRELDLIRVMGKKQPVRIYELIKRRDGDDNLLIDNIKRYENGLALYRERRWDEACLIFDELYQNTPNDLASSVFMDRCRENKTNPPPAEWDGVYSASKG